MDTRIINVSLPSKLLKLADEVAEKEARSRSELFREAIRSYITRKTNWNELFSYAESKAKKMKIKEKDIELIIKSYRTGI